MEEQQLTQRLQRGDRAAQRELYDGYAGMLYAVCCRYMGRGEAAEDLLHDAFLKIFRSIGRFEWRGEGSLSAWMRRVVINLALQQLRQAGKKTRLHFDEEEQTEELEAPTAEEVEQLPQQVLLEMVSRLPEGYRTIFNMFCLDGFSHREIGEVLGISPKTSSSQLYRARQLLAAEIRRYLAQQ